MQAGKHLIEDMKKLAQDSKDLRKKAHFEDDDDNVKKDEDSDYDWDFEDEKEEQKKKVQFKKEIEDKKTVRVYEEQKAKGTLRMGEDPSENVVRMSEDQDLDDLWKRIRNFFDDLNEKGQKRDFKRIDKPNKISFMESCEDNDFEKRGVIPEFLIEKAFIRARFIPMPSKELLMKLFKALEIVVGNDDINYREFLGAPVSREHYCLNGIYPKIKPKGPTQKQIEEKQKKEEDEKRKKQQEELEEKKRKDAADKKLDLMKQSQPKNYKQPTKEEEKMKERERQLKREKDEKEAAKLQQIETEQVKKEVSEFRKAIEQLQKNVKKTGENLKNWFNMFDENKDGFLDFSDLKNLLKQMNVAIRESDLGKVFELMDLRQCGKISYNDFCDVIDRNQILPIDKIVRKRREDRGDIFVEGLQQEEDLYKSVNKKSMQADFGTASRAESRDVGNAEGLSSIMQRSEYGASEGRQFIDDDDTLHIYGEIKEIFKANAFNFDDLLSKMGKAQIAKENVVTFKDFETVVRSMPGTAKLSNQQLRQVFMSYAVGSQSVLDAYIPLIDFKDKFYPGVHWQRQTHLGSSTSSIGSRSMASSALESKTESMHIDNVLAGKKYEDVQKERDLEKERMLRQKEEKYKVGGGQNLFSIKEDRYEAASQSSAPSRAIDDVMNRQDADPRRSKQQPNKSVNPDASLRSLGGEGLDLSKFRVNQEFYRQNEAILTQIPLEEKFKFDKSLDYFLKRFCKSLIDEVSSGPVKRDVTSYVDHYGKDGYLIYAQFREIYLNHIHYVDNEVSKPFNEEAKLRALFGVFDSQSLGRVSKNDFAKTILAQQPPNTLLERLKNKVKKGGDRLIRVLTEEFQEADIPYGSNGRLPISNFQTIMIDYDMPLLENDLQDLRKKALLDKDVEGNEFVKYKEILELAKPRKPISTELAQIDIMVRRVQAVWRGYITRKQVLKMRKSDLQTIGDQYGKVTNRGAKGVTFKEADGDDLRKSKDQSKKMTPQQRKEETEKKKKQMIQTTKAKKKKSESLESRMGQVVKPSKDLKLNERQLQAKKEMTEYIKNTILESIVHASVCYGESLDIGRDIQKKFENRPVKKFVFPMLQEFQYNVVGVQPKSLQTLNELGQVMFLDSENQLNQYDIATNKTLQQVNLGTRPPLRHYDIIDMVCDQTSGRIYTLNQNWILEIWNIEQSAGLPQKRLAVCTNEGNKDYISLYYKNTFNNSKPRFLSLSDHNQQILIANTSCVDGCIVFIDPISFSVLKKIQLRYQDYEIPKKLRDCIKQLKVIFKNIIEQSNKTIFDVFAGIMSKDTQNIKIRDFVQKVASLDQNLKVDEMYKLCSVLDTDNNGFITLDEFLHYFQHLEQDEETDFEKKAAEEELYENIWPEWIVKSGMIEHAKSLLGRMFDTLNNKHGINAEQAFGIYDLKDRGLTTVEDFKRILKIFFNEIFVDQKDIDFILQLTQKTVDQSVMYREFCKFLNKRFIRTFKNVNVTSITDVNKSDAYLKELDQILKKEASINYIIRKSAELNLDLRAIFLKNDENELSVISRTRFQRILESLPLGLLSFETEEIFESDLHFDNYGNVDYTVILNSDIFVQLERQRMRRIAKKRKTVDDSEIDITKDNSEIQKLTDNRKVVVEDLIYLDDLEIIIYTTICPKTSTIFVTHTKKLEKSDQKGTQVEIVTLQSLHTKKGAEPGLPTEQTDVIPNYYQLLARMRGHRNSDPPTLFYVPSSGCLISGEKFLTEQAYKAGKDTFPKADDPKVPVSHKFQKSTESAYERHAHREQQHQYKSEIIIWNIQRDMVELFQSRPPWNVPVFRRFEAHNASIIDICYLQKAQLIVSASTDQTIRFFDPVSVSYDLTDPSNIPHAQQRPGYYKPLLKECTKGNSTFKEVKRIYTYTDTSCFSLRCLNLQSIHLDQSNPDFKSQIEWVVGLQLGKPQYQGRKNTQVGFICGYGLERVKIEVPALHHDDIVPPYVMKECEDLIATRRRRLVTAFQHQLPHKIEKIYSQVALQNSYMAQVRKLFLQAILQRKDIKYVNPEPLREIYKIILKLPNRTKFENFLATSGCSDKLSVSETFFYLQKFMQIHPLRTTQIEFEKSIEEFQEKHSREFLRGTKRWPKQSVQKFANYIRSNGLDIPYLSRDSMTPNQTKANDFCTRERFIQYFNDGIGSKVRFSDLEIDSILTELDPFYTGIIQIQLIQNYYQEEIHFYNLTTLNRPKQIFQDIRSKVFPNKKLALQQALTSVDIQGDGYIQKEQFIEAFQKADIIVDRDVLEFLFDVVAEKYNTVQTEGQTSNEDEKVLSITYFINKLFNTPEVTELNEIDNILQNLKAALIYKGLDFSVIFAENTVENAKTQKQSALDKSSLDDSQVVQTKAKNQPIDLTQHYTRFAQQLVRDEFCQRLEQLNARGISKEQMNRLANFLSLNQKNNSIIYLNSWLHHLRRVQTAFHVPERMILPVICSKLLRNESVFRSYVDSTAELKGRRDDEKIIDIADLRQVLYKFGVTYINQDIFVSEFARNEAIHIEDLVTRMKSCVQQEYNMATSTLNKSSDDSGIQGEERKGEQEMQTLKDLRRTDYFDRVQMKLKKLGGRVNLTELVEKMKQFDQGDSGKIKIYHFINVLKHNYSQIFDQETLIGLQFELECMNSDDCVDYEEFVRLFFEKQSQNAKDEFQMNELKLDKRTTYQIQDYEDLLSRISTHIKQDGLDLMRIFKIFSKNGVISYPDLKKILELIGFQVSETDLRLLIQYADENGDGHISCYEFANQIVFARELAPQFDINKWIVSSRALDGRYTLLEKISAQSDIIKDALISDHGENGHHSGVLTGDQFQNVLRDAQLGFSEYDIDLLTVYAIKGSRRAQSGDYQQQAVNVRNDLVQFFNFEKSLIPVIKQMRKEDTEKKKEQDDMLEDEMARFRKELQRREREQKELQQKHMDPAQRAREQQLQNKILELFVEREVTFFDCFSHLYDPLNNQNSVITVSQFKKSINSLNLPLTVQEHRILRRIADPMQIGKVELNKFCCKFETEELRRKRLNGILEKIATAFYLQNFNLRRAFALFDKDGDGQISKREFRQGWLTLNLGLTYDEIDDLMNIVDNDKSGSISYDEFISKMDIHIQRKSTSAAIEAESIIYQKIKHLLANNDSSLYEIMMNYEYDNSGKILKQDLVRVFKRLGILHPEPHLPLLIKAGGFHENDETIDYVIFSENLQKHIETVLKQNIKQSSEILQKIYAVILAKKYSLFEFFCVLDVNLSGGVSKLEFKTGIQAMGLSITQKEFDVIWKIVKKPEKKIYLKQNEESKQGKRSGRKSDKNEQESEIEQLSYYELLIAFVKVGCLKLQKSVDNTNNLVNKFRQQLKKKNISVEKLYKQLDPEEQIHLPFFNIIPFQSKVCIQA